MISLKNITNSEIEIKLDKENQTNNQKFVFENKYSILKPN